jgi:hypothetical protein
MQGGREDIQVPVAAVRFDLYLQQRAEVHFPLTGEDVGEGPCIILWHILGTPALSNGPEPGTSKKRVPPLRPAHAGAQRWR